MNRNILVLDFASATRPYLEQLLDELIGCWLDTHYEGSDAKLGEDAPLVAWWSQLQANLPSLRVAARYSGDWLPAAATTAAPPAPKVCVPDGHATALSWGNGHRAPAGHTVHSMDAAPAYVPLPDASPTIFITTEPMATAVPVTWLSGVLGGLPTARATTRPLVAVLMEGALNIESSSHDTYLSTVVSHSTSTFHVDSGVSFVCANSVTLIVESSNLGPAGNRMNKPPVDAMCLGRRVTVIAAAADDAVGVPAPA